MASSCSLVAVCLVLVLLFHSMNPLCHGQNQTKSVTVIIIDGLPPLSEKMRVDCESGEAGAQVELLDSGNFYRFSVVKPCNVMIICRAIWRTQIADWHAFQPRRDAGHASVFWLVRQHGFFLSWDNSTWIRRARWETE